MKLTAKQEKFCQQYIICLNASQAAVEAGYSSKTAGAIGHENLKKPEIAARLQELMIAAQERTEITLDAVIREITNVALVRESEFYNDDGSVKKLSELTKEQTAALSSYTIRTIKDGKDSEGNQQYLETPVFSAQDKMKALDMLMKYFGAYSSDGTPGGVGGTPKPQKKRVVIARRSDRK